MAQAKEGHAGAADVVGDYDAICRVLQLCTEGEAKGDAAKLQEAFHADARMFGSLAGGYANREQFLLFGAATLNLLYVCVLIHDYFRKVSARPCDRARHVTLAYYATRMTTSQSSAMCPSLRSLAEA